MSSGAYKKNGPPRHQNATAWKPNRGVKKNDKELGGKLHPYAPITGVCLRCKEKIDWRRKYGKYKPLTEPAKCNQCGKRAVRQAYHAVCSACAKEKNICAKCCCPAERIIGRDAEDEEKERKQLEEALSTLRERDKRSLLRVMEKGPSKLSGRRSGADKQDNNEQDDDVASDESDVDSISVGSVHAASDAED